MRIVLSIAALAAVLLVAFAVLRGGDTAGVSLADAASNVEGESMRMHLEMTWMQDGTEVTAEGEGVSSADGSEGVFDVVYDFDDMGKVSARLLGIGDEMWMRFEGEAATIMPRGKRWVHGVDPEMASSTLTPSEFGSFLAGADDVEERGGEQIRGQATTRYAGMIDIARLADEIGGESEKRLEAMTERADGKRVGLPIEAWVTDDGLPIRMRIDTPAFDMTVDVLEFGVPVEVTPPPAARTIEEAEWNRLTAP